MVDASSFCLVEFSDRIHIKGGVNMFARIGNTWTLMGASLDVLKRQKGLLIFPFLSGVACLAIIVSFIAPLVLGHSTFELPAKDAQPEVLIRFYGYWFLFYFCNYFVVVF